MATIGTFKKTGNEYVGEIVTLNVQAQNVRIVPEDATSGENAPSHRVFVGRAEIGAAWSKRSNEDRDYAIEALLPFWAELKLSHVKGETCRRYAKWRARKPGTVRRELGVLQAAMNYCHKEGYVSGLRPESRAPAFFRGARRSGN